MLTLKDILRIRTFDDDFWLFEIFKFFIQILQAGYLQGPSHDTLSSLEILVPTNLRLSKPLDNIGGKWFVRVIISDQKSHAINLMLHNDLLWTDSTLETYLLRLFMCRLNKVYCTQQKSWLIPK